MRDWFRVEAAQGKGKGGGEILIYDVIGKRHPEDMAVDAREVVEAIGAMVKAGPGDIHVRINSPGGDVGSGMAIYNALRKVSDRVVATIEGYAYSMASVIALAGRETRMADVGQFMVHNPTTLAWGGQKEMEQAIARLRTSKATLLKAYTKKTGKSSDEIEALMDDTTFMTADEAKEFGFVDTIVDGEEILDGVAACFDAEAWAAYFRGEGGMPAEGEKGEERRVNGEGVDGGHGGHGDRPVADGSATGLNKDGGRGAANCGSEDPKESRMKASEIRELCLGASAEFVLAQVEASDKSDAYGAVDVLKAWNVEQGKALEAERTAKAEAEQKAADAEARAAKAAAGKGGAGASASGAGSTQGVEPLGEGGGESGAEASDPIAAFEEAVTSWEKRGKPRAQAIREVCVSNKDVYQAYLCAYNEAHGRNHLAV